MTGRFLKPALLGLAGVAALIALGVWQLQRLDWKQGVLDRIEARIAAEPEPLPAEPAEARDEYRPVAVTGRFDDAQRLLRVLVSPRGAGPGHRLIGALAASDRRLMVDLGYIPADAPIPELPDGPVTVTGNLLWPDSADFFTPEPDRDNEIWFARDVPTMAEALGTRPLMVVARDVTGPGLSAAPARPMPVGTAGIPNNHRNYAITWFSLAVVWAGMTALWMLRIRRGSG